MVFVSYRFENMWAPLGIGVAGFLSGMAWAAMFIQSALVYAYYLLSFSMIVVCVMIAGRETGNNGILKMLALPVSCKILCISLLFMYGNGCFSCCFCDNRIDCNEQYRNHRSIAGPVFIEVVCRIIFDDAPRCGGNLGDYGTI